MPPLMKSIELQGYKTFANKVFFEFPLPITAIVGPNGSGKSNISDAIRWVLGEQSFTVLRGHRTTDMIFSGSDKKARASMASATITFDNTDQWLPIDYQEVAVTRRAYRDGQNEYLINGQRVRLKDVNELLAQSGLSERTYTIIGQGLIDNALSARPEDRRRFFEEAAGIGLFRSRREEALVRLKDTARNLERVTDILSELEPRVHSLERQAKRAAEYGHVTDELKALLREWYGYHWHHAQQDLLVVKERFSQQEKRTAAVREAFEGHDSDLRKKQEEIRAMRIELSEMHNQAAEIHLRIEQLTRENAILDERKNAALVQVQRQQEESAVLSEELTAAEARAKELDETLAGLRKEKTEAAEQKAKYAAEYHAGLEELNGLRNELRSKRDEQEKLESRLIRLKARRDDLTDRTNSMEEAIPGMRTSLERIETGLRTFQRENEKFYTAQKENEARLTGLNAGIAEFEHTLAERDGALRSLRADKNRVDADFSRASARLDVLKDAERHMTGMNRGAQFVAESARKGNLRGIVRSLQSLLDVPKEYETAAAAVLGDELDAVVLDVGEWSRAMDLLHKNQNGRAVLVPECTVNDTKPAEPDDGIRGCRPLLSLLGYSEKDAPVLAKILSGAYLAETRGQAMQLRNELKPGQCIVTPDGDLFRADGSAVSGSEGRQKLLSRTREIHELEKERDQIKAQSDQIADQIRTAEKDAAAQREKLKEMQTDRAKLQTSAVELQKKLSQLAVEKEKQTQSAAFQRQRLNDSIAQVETNRAQIGEISAQITELESGRESFRSDIRAIQDRINKVQLNELQEQVQHWNVTDAVLQKSVTEAETRVRENKNESGKVQKKMAQLAERSAAAEKTAQDLEEQINSLKGRIEEETRLSADFSEKTEPVERALKAAEEQLQHDQKSFQDKQQTVVSAERMLAQAQLEVTRHDDHLEALKKRIEDDLGMVNFIYDEKIEGQTALPLNEIAGELPKVEILSENLEEEIQRLKNHLRRMGAVNPEAITEFKESSERYQFLKTQMADLKKADADLRQVIAELDRMMENAFLSSFEKVQAEFKQMFVRLFGGGSARLELTDPNDVNSSGIEIEAKLPGHREQELSLLSGGERSLTSVALIFSLLRVSPTPFCVLDEVDAALDEANVGRFCDLLKELSADTQFLVITHNRNTVEASNVIYGITMAADSTSQAVSLKLDEIRGDILK